MLLPLNAYIIGIWKENSRLDFVMAYHSQFHLSPHRQAEIETRPRLSMIVRNKLVMPPESANPAQSLFRQSPESTLIVE